MNPLDVLAKHQAEWSKTADKLKATIDRARWSVFGFSILGATAAAVASQMSPADPNAVLWLEPHTRFAVLGAVSLFAATFFSGRLLSPDDVSNWVRARAISERLKHEAYKFAARVSPYDKDEANAGAALNAARIQIEKDGVDLGSKKVTKAKPDKRMPRERFVSPDEYVTRRVQDQIGWFGEKVDGYKQTVFWLKLAEFVLALAAGVITTVASVIGKSVPLLGQTFDIAAFTAVLTTIAGIVLAHIEASRVDYLIASYLATKARLEDRTGVRSEPWKDFSDPDWPDFVNACEDILATENASWITKLSRNP